MRGRRARQVPLMPWDFEARRIADGEVLLAMHLEDDATDGRRFDGDSRVWWRWGRVELPVQKPSPETTTSVSYGLSSIARAAIGSLPNAPVTSPCGL